MKAFRNRAAEKARQAAGGGDGPPAGRDPQVPGEAPTPTVADRGVIRKRLRAVRKTRDELLHDLGALVMEMHRQGRHDPVLVERKAREAIAVDTEFRGLSGALAAPPVAQAPAPAAAPVSAPPPAAADRVTDAPPPSPGDRASDPPPPSPADRVEDGVPTYTVTTR
jgi:hypothetical protein